MLNHPFLELYARLEGRAFVPWAAERTRLSAPTLRNGGPKRQRDVDQAARNSRQYVEESLNRIGEERRTRGEPLHDDRADWLCRHPSTEQAGAICAGLVYEAQSGSMACPETLAFAKRIDELSTHLLAAKEQDDILAFKKLLGMLDGRYFRENEAEHETLRHLPVLSQAKTWVDLQRIWQTVTMNTAMSFLAHWDVEFVAVYMPELEPRPLFALVLPRLDPVYGEVEVGVLPKQRDMIWLPVRRLVDVMACMGERVCTGKWPEAVPAPGAIAQKGDVEQSSLTNWRDGTKKFRACDFSGLWTRLSDGRLCPTPWPLFVAASFWQAYLVEAVAPERGRAALLVQPEYSRLVAPSPRRSDGQGPAVRCRPLAELSSAGLVVVVGQLLASLEAVLPILRPVVPTPRLPIGIVVGI